MAADSLPSLWPSSDSKGGPETCLARPLRPSFRVTEVLGTTNCKSKAMNMRLNPNGSNEFWNEDIDIRYSVKLLLGGCCWNKGMDSHYLDLEDSGDMQLYNPMAKCLLVC